MKQSSIASITKLSEFSSPARPQIIAIRKALYNTESASLKKCTTTNIKERTIYILDSYNKPHEERVENCIKVYCRVIPFILEYLGFHEKRKNYKSGITDFNYEWLKTPYQKNTETV
ncbi:hypothetical protein F8388_008771 [Cannabis sativa]|uniref:Ubiquitin-like protease family profile domain-containing protein n=1 Tax=Cannabis sativa TaxID=3483 RepID=A0A7J6E0A8_CANSA|nr:hypothetical protein F8388_008771 [Cannabis sativa]